MKLPRRRFLHPAAGTVALPAMSRMASAQTYPTRPITMIVPFTAGSATDVVARVLAEWMGRSLGHPIVIENVTGAEGSIGVGRVARAKPDGQTIGPAPVSWRVAGLDQGILSDGILPSCLVAFFCSAPGGAILPSRPARECGRRAQRRSRTAPLRGRPKGLSLTAASTAAAWCASGLAA